MYVVASSLPPSWGSVRRCRRSAKRSSSPRRSFKSLRVYASTFIGISQHDASMLAHTRARYTYHRKVCSRRGRWSALGNLQARSRDMVCFSTHLPCFAGTRVKSVVASTGHPNTPGEMPSTRLLGAQDVRVGTQRVGEYRFFIALTGDRSREPQSHRC